MKNYNLHRMKDLINDFIETNGYEEYFILENVKRDWHLFVGEIASSKIRIKSLKDGVLSLATHSSVWRSEFMLRKSEFIKKINTYYKKEIIKDITI